MRSILRGARGWSQALSGYCDVKVGQIRVVRMCQGTQERRDERDEEEKRIRGRLSALLCFIKSSVLQDTGVAKKVHGLPF